MRKCIKLEESLLACLGVGSWMLQKCKAKHQSCNFVKVDGRGLTNITAISVNNFKPPVTHGLQYIILLILDQDLHNSTVTEVYGH